MKKKDIEAALRLNPQTVFSIGSDWGIIDEWITIRRAGSRSAGALGVRVRRIKVIKTTAPDGSIIATAVPHDYTWDYTLTQVDYVAYPHLEAMSETKTRQANAMKEAADAMTIRVDRVAKKVETLRLWLKEHGVEAPVEQIATSVNIRVPEDALDALIAVFLKVVER